MARTKLTSRPEPGVIAPPRHATPPIDRIVASAPDVFGPSHPLFELVSSSTQLPDVITRLIVLYTSHVYPRQAHYNGNVTLTHSTGILYNSTTASSDASSSSTSSSLSSSSSPVLSSSSSSTTAPSSSHASSSTEAASSSQTTPSSFSLHDRSWSMCGWMCRARGGLPAFLMSIYANQRATPINTHVHVGYTCHPHGAPTNCFTVGFYANDLDVQPPLVDVNGHHEWEHWCTTLHYPRPHDCGPYIPPATQHTHADYKNPDAPNLARRRLYRNGMLLAEDDCQPPHIDHSHTLVLGRYDMVTFSSLDGGLCDVRVYSRALEVDEVQALYQGEEEAGSSGDGLEMWYKLDATDFSSDVARDSSGHGRHAVVDGSLLQLSMTGDCNRNIPD